MALRGRAMIDWKKIRKRAIGKNDYQPSGPGTITRITAHQVEVLWEDETARRYRRAQLHNLRHAKLICELHEEWSMSEPSSREIVKFRDGLHETILSNETVAPAGNCSTDTELDPTFCWRSHYAGMRVGPDPSEPSGTIAKEDYCDQTLPRAATRARVEGIIQTPVTRAGGCSVTIN
jgi:hypothetical protein